MKFSSATILFVALLAAPAAGAEIAVTDTPQPPVVVPGEASSGLEAVIVVRQARGAHLQWTQPAGSAPARWSRFSSLGGGYAEEAASTLEGPGVSSVPLTDDDMGYIVDDGAGRRYCYWVVNYANHPLRLEGLDVSGESDCLTATLLLRGDASKITYYTVNGAPRTLGRDLRLRYATMVYDEASGAYAVADHEELLPWASAEIHAPQPLTATDFTLSGDRFLQAWGAGQEVSSPSVDATAVEGRTQAQQTPRDADNEQKDGGGGQGEGGPLGGSAPVEVTFTAAVTDAAIFREWQMAADPEFDIIDLRFNELEVTHTFRDFGTTYVRFLCANADGACQWTSEVYEVAVGESRLEIPNAFTPGTSEGVNDLWKVSYKSLVEFDCHIFNRWGQELCHLTDPSQGWDGRTAGGKLVPAGVYFYVITARGADGRNYKEAGDINIIGFRRDQGSSGGAPQ